ncbi:glucans biosynthesis glucosyltransferase MdoH [Stappia sp. MMSF_3263]|uniref:glucans biosynthesis glucosyltransferase MdoH n=1 Tax=Stappia sp. MMSF_3263 TaxID=3046693 RepID=UPI00273D358C|nr:glucans biosynthesis glucosyltransferase MdoH [Stappia sp. MMSF_3263]
MFYRKLPSPLNPDTARWGVAEAGGDRRARMETEPVDARRVALRRVAFSVLVVGTVAALTALLGASFSSNGISWAEALMIACFLLTLPWTAIGFWNAVIGLALMRLSRDPVAAVCPLSPGDPHAASPASTAILSCIRNEDVDEVSLRLDAMAADLDRAGRASGFALYVLSDTNDEDIAAREARVFAALAERWAGRLPVIYRRRTDNPGFKAGNIRDFLGRWGSAHDYAIVLDADSFMSARTMLDLVARMDANPRLGILQTLVVGSPTVSAFARIFQFGMRLGMRSYTLGSAWWQGDCGPYWGHNAIWRVKPFAEHCELPVLPGRGPLSGWVLSHDQVEAVLMRRAGHEVRVLPVETESFEENPPNLLEFIRRELRWCQGNLQYLKLLGLAGLKPVSRIQLVLAILMFASAPAWLTFMATGAVIVALGGAELIRFEEVSGFTLFVIVLTMIFAPKIATFLDILADPKLRRAFGGVPRIAASWFVELVFAALMAPVIAVAVSLFIAGLPFGKAIGWGAQIRDNRTLPLGLCAAKLWPQTLFGLAGFAWAAAFAPGLVWPLLPVILGPALAIPFARLTSGAAAGRLALASRLWRLPEEAAPPDCLLPLRLPAHASLGVSFGRPAPLFAGEMAKAEA